MTSVSATVGLNYDILHELKSKTSEAHASIERTIDFMRPEIDLSDYRRQLERFLGFYRPFENRLHAHRVRLCEAGVDPIERSKTGWLEHDLLRLGLTPQEIVALPETRTLPDLADLADCLGALYVVEGSTLGGQVICRHLKAILPEQAVGALSFYGSYGARTGVMWKLLCERLRAELTCEESGERAVRSAQATFATLESWLAGD